MIMDTAICLYAFMVQFLLLDYVPQCYGMSCSFPAGYTSRAYWLLGRDTFQSVPLNLWRYADPMLAVQNTNVSAVIGYYQCPQFHNAGSEMVYVRTQTSTSNRDCVDDRLLDNGLVLHRERAAYSPSATISGCNSTLVASDTVFSLYTPVQSTEPFKLNLTGAYPFIHGTYALKYRLSDADERCTSTPGQVTIANSVITITSCRNETTLPLSGLYNALTAVDTQVFGESGASKMMLVEWQAGNLRQVYCVRYEVSGVNLYLSFDISSTTRTYCQKDADPRWYGNHGGRAYLLLTLTLTSAATTTSPGSTTPASITTTTLNPGETTTIDPNATTTIDTNAPTTKINTPKPTPAPVTPDATTDSSNDTAKNQTQGNLHVQFALGAPTLFSDIKDPVQFASKSTSEIADACGVDASRIESIILQEGKNGEVVVTFDLLPPVDDTLELTLDEAVLYLELQLTDTNSTNSTATITVDGTDYALKAESVYSWRDTDPCDKTACPSNSTCWVLQGDYSCESSLPTTSPSTNNSTFWTQTNIIIIAVVCGILFLVLLIVLIVCCIKKKKKNKNRIYNTMSNEDSPKASPDAASYASGSYTGSSASFASYATSAGSNEGYAYVTTPHESSANANNKSNPNTEAPSRPRSSRPR